MNSAAVEALKCRRNSGSLVLFKFYLRCKNRFSRRTSRDTGRCL